jgi:hypothetical protein
MKATLAGTFLVKFGLKDAFLAKSDDQLIFPHQSSPPSIVIA